MKINHYLFFLMLVFLNACALPRPKSIVPDVHAQALINQGVLALRAGDLEKAQAAFQVSLEIEASAAAIDGLGCVSLLAGKLGEAEQLFHKALEFAPDYISAVRNLAMVFEQRGDWKRAERLYQRVIQKDPQDFRARNNLAALWMTHRTDSRRHEDAKIEFTRAGALLTHPLILHNQSLLETQNGNEQTSN